MIRAEHERILDAVAAMWGVDVAELRGPSRCASIAHPRHVAMWLIRKRCQATLSRVGLILGGRDHTSVVSGCQRVEHLIGVDVECRNRIAWIERELDRIPEVANKVETSNV